MRSIKACRRLISTLKRLCPSFGTQTRSMTTHFSSQYRGRVAMQPSESTNSIVMTWLPWVNRQPAHHFRATEKEVRVERIPLLNLQTKRQRTIITLITQLQCQLSKAVASRTTVCSATRPKANSQRRSLASQPSAVISARFLRDQGLQVSLLDMAFVSRNFSRLSWKQSMRRTLKTRSSTCPFLNYLRLSTIKRGGCQLHRRSPRLRRLMTRRRSTVIRLTFSTRQRSQNSEWNVLTAAKSSLDLMKSKRLE